MSTVNRVESRQRRHFRLRKKVNGTAERPRLAVYKSNKYIYAQIINDETGETVVFANSLEKDLKAKNKGCVNIKVAEEIGKMIGERAIAKGIKSVVFDRGGFIYHGRVKALADGARASGLEF